ncbi:EAL domain-containing protein [Rhizobium sp. 32-5/1]|uniref:putative bifunctional diguanylate cyclase/phosphodiesterase n=1 Tax=Rhizobium sp. 32-5/1 TaxID=3019602 RepID=UPI00240E21A2|nr:EAL domain-containing protein [Rhizobium sp. 32-5/1]WEZ83329.1 EAL domain-containing protein [Rhizobium sp. 32-5/1]
MLQKMRAFLAVDAKNPELIQAQLAAFSKQVPLLYFTLLTNTIALSLTHYNSAPLLLSFYLPCILYVGCLVRIWFWWRTRRRVVPHEKAVRQLQGTIYLAGVLGFCFTAWALALFPYGGAYAKGHVAFYMANTVIGCIFCLMHVRAAALVLTAVVLVPFTLFFATTGNAVFVAIALNMMLVVGAMVYILFSQYRDFNDLIGSQKALIAKQKETQSLSDENRRLANLDSLTDLPNRRSFQFELDTRLAAATRQKRPLAVGIIDLDGFKPVNDAFGHAVGDRLLMAAARRLGQFTSEHIFAARLGGDEFGLIVEGDLDEKALAQLGDAVCTELQRPYHLNGITAKVSGSLGFAQFPTAGDNAAHLFEQADFALYHAKQHARGGTVVFSQEHEREIMHQSRVDQELKSADLARELHILFQPFIDTDTQQVLGFEALARWDNAMLGRVSPDVFIRSAERSGMMGRMTAILFTKALQTAVQWPRGTRLSFNLSARDIVARPTLETLLAVLEESGFDPHFLDVEVTETSVMTNFEVARCNLNLLIERGIGIALDDFGTGHSSLGYVHRLPLRKIKIDRSFITDIGTDGLSQNIVKTIVDLCRNIGCVCVVEGMETLEQVTILRRLGCSIMQGFYFGRPMHAAQTLDLLDTKTAIAG